MGRTNIEKEFRDKLNQREIQPSENSWDRLDAMLTVAEQKKPERKFRWMYIAASFLGVALIATIFFNRESGVEVSNKVAIEVEESPAIMRNDLPEKTMVVEQTAIASSDKNQKDENSIQPMLSIKTNQNHIAQNHKKEQIAIISNDAAPETINQKTDIVKADELLAIVQPANNQNKTKTVKVNAKSLLSQVDGEVDLTFREKVLNKVGKNYQSVKVALSNRNIEEENH